jgi:hypothetical protein
LGDVPLRNEFVFDERLGIHIIELLQDWEEYNDLEREEILYFWEQIRGCIPERVIQLEQMIIKKQEILNQEDIFSEACMLNWEIADLASIINDLHLWYRINQNISTEKAHQ